MATVTTSFSSLTNIENTRKEILNSKLNLGSAILYAYNAYNNGQTYDFYSYDTRTSSKVSGTLTNGDYAIVKGNMLYPTNITSAYYMFSGLDTNVLFTCSLSQAYNYAPVTGTISQISVSKGDWDSSVIIIGDNNVANSVGSISSFIVQKSGAMLVGDGNLSARVKQDYYGSQTLDLSGNLHTLKFISGSQRLEISGVQVDVMSISKYASVNDLLTSVLNGNDNITGSSGVDYVVGYAGNDTLDGGYGSDAIDGGAGSNTAVYNGYKSSYSVSKSGATYSVSNLFEGTDTLTNIAYLQFADGTVAIDDALPKPVVVPPVISPEPVVLPVIAPVAVTSIIRGTSADDFLTGTDSDNKILGGAGNDTLTGGLGNDTLNGGAGKDLLVGGKGADVFVSFIDSKNTRDTISDFSHQEGDKIDLSIIDANTNKAGNQAFSKLDIGAKFSGKFTATGQLFFDTTTQILWGNVDTKAGADFSIQLNGVSSLVVGDFVL